MKIGITGATGFIGSHLAAQARQRGHEVVAFSRSPDRPKTGFSETRRFTTDFVPDLSGLDAIVHLAGESIIGLWTPSKKRRIRESRVEGTRRIVEGLSAQPDGPKILVCGSAIGYYGDTRETIVDESSASGRGFLAEVARLWESEAGRAPDSVRTTKVRIGFVLGDGGAMKLVGPVFKAGLGGRLGDGQQWMSCVHVDDVAGLILHSVENEGVSGPLNAVMPEPVPERRIYPRHGPGRAPTGDDAGPKNSPEDRPRRTLPPPARQPAGGSHRRSEYRLPISLSDGLVRGRFAIVDVDSPRLRRQLDVGIFPVEVVHRPRARKQQYLGASRVQSELRPAG